MTTLLEICKTVLRETGNFSVPSTIVNNSNPTAIQLLALANRSGKNLARDHGWQVLLGAQSFTTIVDQQSYELPAAFGRFANLTWWDSTNTTMVEGPVSQSRWQMYQSSGLGAAVGFRKAFRLSANQIDIYPTPSAEDAITYQYYSKYWISGQTEFEADDDEPLIDADLILLDMKWRFRSAKGFAYDEEKNDFMKALDIALAHDGGKGVIQFGGGQSSLPGNIPETGFGAA